jgi:hypothetical protein
MKDKSKLETKISRRGMLPLLGGSLLLPFFGFGNVISDETTASKDEEFQILLKADGTTVKVKISTINKSKPVEKKISNKALHKWLKKKL